MKTIFIYLSLLLPFWAVAQKSTGMGTLDPNPSAALEIGSADQGVLFPRVALLGMQDLTTIENGNIPGLVVYNTANVGSLNEGYYYWNDKWISMTAVALVSGLSKLAFSKKSTGGSVKKYRDDQAIPGLTFVYSPVSDGNLDIAANIYSTLSSNAVRNIASKTVIKIKVNGETVSLGINCPMVISGYVSNPSMISLRSAVRVRKGEIYNFEVTATEVYAGSSNNDHGSSSGTVSWGTYSAQSSIAANLIQD